MGNDRFEEFARKSKASKRDFFEQPQPISYEKVCCVLGDKVDDGIYTEPKISTKDELLEELKKARAHYAPYLRDLAPKITETRKTIDITSVIDEEGNTVSIPFYNGPVGNAVKCYYAEFDAEKEEGKAAYIRFMSADYKAAVYINDVCVGMHEGFFSPFEFEITNQIQNGKNKLKIVLENDFCYMGNGLAGEINGDYGQDMIEGDKLYAATGPGYDDPLAGWHHCPPGMGIFDSVTISFRDICNITDIFVQPHLEEKKATAFIELEYAEYKKIPVTFKISVYGQNFEECVIKDMEVVPEFKGELLSAKHGKNIYNVTFDIPDPKVWSPDTPNLYQIQVSAVRDGKVCDTQVCQFGMRSFTQDLETVPKGRFYLNGEQIKLRGANTMGFEQQDAIDGNIDQLIDDILLSKICNMNYWRLTQRPVQEIIYSYCDKLGLMTQSDLPLFGVMRRNKLCEATRQAEEMARLVRKHPCNIVVTYINERWENANFEPHRHMLHDEMEMFFEVCDRVVKYNHPDCVIKHVEGDFDPPSWTTLPDYHCYTMWYNGAQIEFGKLYRGYAQPVSPEWCYGCGEYGAEGMDFPDLMRRRYPASWIEEPFDPGKVISAQSKLLHGSFMDTPKTLEEWSYKTQKHQGIATRLMTESFRRDPRMVSTAIHLFIDAWPSGWMKAIMDCERNPKDAYFTCRNAFEPILLSLRSDRFTYYENETVSIEAYICNDTQETGKDGWKMNFELYRGDELVKQGATDVKFTPCDVTYVANAEFEICDVKDREKCVLKAILTDENGKVVSYNTFDFEVFKDLGEPVANDDIVLITSLENGTHEIAGETVTVSDCPHDGVNFLSRRTNHPVVDGFKEHDFYMWYNKELDRLSPIAEQCFKADGFTPILNCNGDIDPYIAVGVKEYEGKKYVIMLADMRVENPIAKRFLKKLYEM